MGPIHPSCSRHKDDLCFMGPEMCGQLPGTTLCVARWAAPSVAKRPRAPPPMPPPEGCVGRPRRGAAVPKTGFAGAPRSAPVDLSTHQITPKPMKPPILCCQISRISPRWLHEHTCGTEYAVDSLDPAHLLPISGATKPRSRPNVPCIGTGNSDGPTNRGRC